MPIAQLIIKIQRPSATPNAVSIITPPNLVPVFGSLMRVVEKRSRKNEPFICRELLNEYGCDQLPFRPTYLQIYLE